MSKKIESITVVTKLGTETIHADSYLLLNGQLTLTVGDLVVAMFMEWDYFIVNWS